MFLDISKAFDKVWHQDLLYKLKQNSILNNLLGALTDFLKDRQKRLVSNGQNSSWVDGEAGVPQDSILRDLPGNISTNAKLSAEDSSLFSVVYGICPTFFMSLLSSEQHYMLSF